MVIDSSALIAVLQNEPDAGKILQAIVLDAARLLSAPSYFETSMVVQSRRDDDGIADLEKLMLLYKINIEPFTEKHAHLARRAFRKYGKGRHPANLNFGDCIAYALAKDTGEPLLFKGDDFGKTDIAAVSF